MFTCLSSGLVVIASILSLVGFAVGNMFSYSPLKNIVGTSLLFLGIVLFTLSFFMSSSYFLYGFVLIILLAAFIGAHYKDFIRACKQVKAGE